MRITNAQKLNDIEMQVIEMLQKNSTKGPYSWRYGYPLQGLKPSKSLKRHSYARILKILAEYNRPVHRWEFFGKKPELMTSRWDYKHNKIVPCYYCIDANRGRGCCTLGKLKNAGLVVTTRQGCVLTELGRIYATKILPKLIAA